MVSFVEFPYRLTVWHRFFKHHCCAYNIPFGPSELETSVAAGRANENRCSISLSISEVSNYLSSEAIETVIERNRGLGRDDFPVFYDGWRTLDNGAVRKSEVLAIAR